MGLGRGVEEGGEQRDQQEPRQRGWGARGPWVTNEWVQGGKEQEEAWRGTLGSDYKRS